MKNSKIIGWSVLHSLGIVIYILGVSLIMMNAGRFEHKNFPPFLGFTIFLTLFVLSAAVVGSLMFARPILMYLDGQKKEAVKFLLSSIMWLAILFIIIVLFVILS